MISAGKWNCSTRHPWFLKGNTTTLTRLPWLDSSPSFRSKCSVCKCVSSKCGDARFWKRLIGSCTSSYTSPNPPLCSLFVLNSIKNREHLYSFKKPINPPNIPNSNLSPEDSTNLVPSRDEWGLSKNVFMVDSIQRHKTRRREKSPHYGAWTLKSWT